MNADGEIGKHKLRSTVLIEEEDRDSLEERHTLGRLSSIQMANEYFRSFILEQINFQSNA